MQDTQGTELEQMLTRIAAKDRMAFDRLYATTSARLYALCLAILRDRSEAETTLKDVFVRIWHEAERFQAGQLSPSAWLATLTRNTAIDRLHNRPEPQAGARPPTTAIAAHLAALAHPAEAPGPVQGPFDLDAADSRALRRVYLQGMGIPELAATEGMSEAEARSHLRAILASLVDPDPATLPDRLMAGELMLGLLPEAEAQAAVPRLSSDPEFAGELRDWQERLSVLVDRLTPVLPPARARQRLREELGHGAPPLSVDLAEPKRGSSWIWLLLALLLIGGLIFILRG